MERRVSMSTGDWSCPSHGAPGGCRRSRTVNALRHLCGFSASNAHPPHSAQHTQHPAKRLRHARCHAFNRAAGSGDNYPGGGGSRGTGGAGGGGGGRSYGGSNGDMFGPVTKAILAINVAMFLLDQQPSVLRSLPFELPRLLRKLRRPGDVKEQLALKSWLVEDGEWWRMFTCTMAHADVYHILANSMSLLSLSSLEAVVGGPRFLLIYLGSALAGSMASMRHAQQQAEKRRRNVRHSSVGASGAVFGIMGARCVLPFINRAYRMVDPRALMQVMAFSWAVDFCGVVNMDHMGHAGGLAGGAALMLLLCPR